MASKYKGPKGYSWAKKAFESKAARTGGVIRRSIAAATKANGVDELINIAKSMRYPYIENGGQIIIFCNTGPIHVHLAPY